MCPKHLRWASLLAALVVVAVVLLQVGATHGALSTGQENQRADQQVANAGASAALTSLFDFGAYKRLFKKTYSGVAESLVRFNLFMSRALRAYISAAKYRLRHARFHLALNHMSDRSPGELDRMRNRKLEEQSALLNTAAAAAAATNSSASVGKVGADLPELIPAEGEDVLDTLRRVIDAHKGEPEFEALRAQLVKVEGARRLARRKRDVREADGPREEELPARELTLDKLISLPQRDPDSQLPARTRAKIRARPSSNNPNYVPIEPITQGLVDQQKELPKLALYRESMDPLASQLGATLQSLQTKYLRTLGGGGGGGGGGRGAPVRLPDEVFLDLRKESNCFLSPRSQGDCGSCYAFAAITVSEWLHCMTTGELVAFSEQYVVDCGRSYMKDDLVGCQGGYIHMIAPFFHNFGWELRANYPYRGREQQCPYSQEADLRSTGYIRADLRKNVQFELDAWPQALRMHGPLIINVDGDGAIHEYGGGIYDACKPNVGNHAVVVLGHGREDGEEYWLIRNSWSAGWGEGGYMKLAKKANCVFPLWGWTFGSNDGLRVTMQPERNAANDAQAVRNLYKAQALEAIRPAVG